METESNHPPEIQADYLKYRTSLRRDMAQKFVAPGILAVFVCAVCLYVRHMYQGMPAADVKAAVLSELMAVVLVSGVIGVLAVVAFVFLRFKPFRG